MVVMLVEVAEGSAVAVTCMAIHMVACGMMLLVRGFLFGHLLRV